MANPGRGGDSAAPAAWRVSTPLPLRPPGQGGRPRARARVRARARARPWPRKETTDPDGERVRVHIPLQLALGKDRTIACTFGYSRDETFVMSHGEAEIRARLHTSAAVCCSSRQPRGRKKRLPRYSSRMATASQGRGSAALMAPTAHRMGRARATSCCDQVREAEG